MMKDNQRTQDGRPITAAVSGFGSYVTDDTANPTPPHNLSPDDILNRITQMQSVLRLPELKHAVELLYKHINDYDNPHQTSMQDYLDDVVDVVYQEYIRRGGTGSKDRFVRSLFAELRIASVDEMDDPENNGSCLISIRGATRYIDNHERDPNAHMALLNRVLVGDPPLYSPSQAIYAFLGISQLYLHPEEPTDDGADYDRVPYSYVDKDGVIRYCISYNDLRPDYGYNIREALLPCFGVRTNLIPTSTDFSKCRSINVRQDLLQALDPENGTTATTITTNRDTDRFIHRIIFSDIAIPYHQARTFSLHIRPLECRYAAFAYKDMQVTSITTYAIFDLQNKSTFVVNDLGRYTSHIAELANGWCRCEFTMNHDIGQISDLEVIFFQVTNENWDMSFQGDQTPCAEIWGAQFEAGCNASPYMPTRGKMARRYPVNIDLPLDGIWWNGDDHTIHTSYVAPRKLRPEDKYEHRPLLSIVDDNDLPSLDVWYDLDGNLYLARYGSVTVEDVTVPTLIFQDMIPYQDAEYHQLVHGLSVRQVITLLNERYGMNVVVPDQWAKGSVLYIGRDTTGSYLDSYFRSIAFYPRQATEEEAEFMNGEQIHGSY